MCVLYLHLICVNFSQGDARKFRPPVSNVAVYYRVGERTQWIMNYVSSLSVVFNAFERQ